MPDEKTTTTARRTRRRKPESLADWAARIGAQVEKEYRKVCTAPPLVRLLSTHLRGPSTGGRGRA